MCGVVGIVSTEPVAQDIYVITSYSIHYTKLYDMGQQIAGDDPLFAGAGVAGATRAVDLSIDEGEGGELDMDFGGEDLGQSDVIDLGAMEYSGEDDGVDFLFDDDDDGRNNFV